MRLAIDIGVELDVTQAEIGREINDPDTLRQRLDSRLRQAVWQTAENDINSTDIDIRELLQIRQSQMGQMRKERTDRMPGIAVGGEPSNGQIGMSDDQAQELRAGIAAGSRIPTLISRIVVAIHSRSHVATGLGDRPLTCKE